MVELHHEKGIDKLKLGCNLVILANFCLDNSTNAKFYLFTESNKDLRSKVRDNLDGGPSIVFTRKAVVEETHIRTSIVGLDATQHYPYPMCQPMPTGHYTRYEFNADLQRLKPRQN